MKRRLYFLFPDPTHVRTAVDDLLGLGVEPAQMHAVARSDIDLGGLPAATRRQRHDALARVEDLLWYGNLVLFGIGVIVLAIAGLAGYPEIALAAIAVMVATVAGGAWFAIRIPHVHLEEFQHALNHGDILLMVDVARDCVEDVEQVMQYRHPEAVTGGSGWTPNLFGA